MFAIANFSRLIMACLHRIDTAVSALLDGKQLLGDLVLDAYCASYPAPHVSTQRQALTCL
jgi:hypothetical protein